MESKLLVEEKGIVTPGQVLATGMEYLPSKGTYRAKDKILANRLGLAQVDGKVIKTIPLAGRYLPKQGDIVVGRVSDVLISGWRIQLYTMYDSVLSLMEASNDYIKRGEDLTRYFSIGDWVIAKVTNVTSQNLVDVTMRGPGLRKLGAGTVAHVSAAKVPRVIGKRGSMVTMIKKATGCDLMVGQNGVIWVSGEPEMENLAIETIKFIEKNSQLSGLTQTVKEFLEAVTGKEVE
jgi:exosome complex component RRP4